MTRMVSPADVEKAVGLVAQGVALLQEYRVDDALRCLNDALDAVPNFPVALVRRGLLFQALSRHREALDDFERCLAVSSKLEHVKPMRDASLQAVLAEIDAQIKTSETSAQLLHERGKLLVRAHRDADAITSLQQAIDIDARHIDSLIELGNLYLRLNRHRESLACYKKILEFAPDNVLALFNLGNVLQQNGQYPDALASYDAALLHKPGFAEVIIEQAHCHLASGNLKAGWPLFEARWNTGQLRRACLPTDAPMWQGETVDTSRTLLLWAEQGSGDTLQFVRYLPLVRQRVERIVLRVQPALKSLLAYFAQRIARNVVVIDNSEALPAHDVHCPLMSLPMIFESDLQTLPTDIPYLHAADANVEKWRAALGAPNKPRIGIVWAGGQRLLNNPTRDMSLALLLPLLTFDAEWIGLQQSISNADNEILVKTPQLRNVGDQLSDFADTAGLVEQLDLLISVDSSVAHLAGALGKPVWLMLRKSGEWRWMQGRNNTPWYPQHQLFRQQAHGDWTVPVQQMVQSFPEFAANIKRQ